MLKVKSFVFSPIQENTYILYNGSGQALIIDPGCYYPGEKDELDDFITQSGLTPQMLLNTHCHLDHIFGNKHVAERYGLLLQIHEKEKLMLEYSPSAGLMYNLPFDNYSGELVFLKEGDTIRLGEDTLTVIEAPGHSPGHLCFYCAEQDFLLGGDVLFNRSIGRTDLPGGNHPQLIRSIREKLFVLPDKTVVYSGHGPVTTIGEEKRENPFLN
ncbi:MAG: MBL fold metallo-hydrolase [Ferruginibacter sp.]